MITTGADAVPLHWIMAIKGQGDACGLLGGLLGGEADGLVATAVAELLCDLVGQAGSRVQQRLGVAALQDEIKASVATTGERC